MIMFVKMSKGKLMTGNLKLAPRKSLLFLSLSSKPLLTIAGLEAGVCVCDILQQDASDAAGGLPKRMLLCWLESLENTQMGR